MYVTVDKTVLCLEEGDPVERTNTRCNELAQSFLKSEWSERVRDELAPYMEAFQNVDNVSYEDHTMLTYHTGPFTQVRRSTSVKSETE